MNHHEATKPHLKKGHVKTVIGLFFILLIALVVKWAPDAAASPTTSCCEDEFAWADDYVTALYDHGVGDLVMDLGIPFINDVSGICDGRETRASIQSTYGLTNAQTTSVVAAAADVCGVK